MITILNNRCKQFKTADLVIDAFVILFQICLYMSFFTYIIVDRFSFFPIFVVFPITLVLHLYRFGYPQVHFVKSPFLVLLFVILLFDLLQYSIIGTLTGGRIVDLLNMILFTSYLYNCYYSYLFILKSRQKALDILLRPYICYSLYNIITIVLLLMLVLLGIASFSQNLVDGSTYSLLANNERLNNSYTFPLCLSFIRHENFYRVFDIPGVCGLFHEQQLLCIFVLPSIMMLLFDDRIHQKHKHLKYPLVITFIIILVITRSSTAFIASSVVVFIYLCKFHKINIMYFVLFLFSIFILFVNYKKEIVDLINGVVIERVLNEDSSKQVSVNFLSYMLSPEYILGTGNLLSGGDVVANRRDQIGFITCILDCSLYVYILGTILLKLFISNCKGKQGYFFGLLYYFLHAIKAPMYVMHIPFFAFNLFLLSILSSNHTTNFSLLKRLKDKS